MVRIAVIDDDPVETVLLSELSKEVGDQFDFVPFSTLEAFVEGGADGFQLAFLDRRIPPHEEFSETLPEVAKSGFKGRVVLMTAHDPGVDIDDYPFEVIGPVEKMSLLDVKTLGEILCA